ncbi:transcription factor IBH1-like [Prunus yedoensis var. nudiflora]|uniref:Transcription factor IBH1-like n=1 Tax=Prunus yedoensis var. nudiflora TaxID=2094558 RepID=A0A314U9X1_PRUYE|nr:transcription factor IBH1-like [Prunus yedoensis var. nudiflora]
MNPKSLSLRPKTSLKSRFTKGFLQALKRIHRQRSRSPNVSSPREMCRRYLSVKIAADASMASAVGSRRAWSRALLTRIRNGAPRVYKYSARRIDNSKKKKKKKCEDGEEIGVICEANELRKFVPGGEAMDICSLLDEAAHYIKCLNTQVKVMRRIADIYSAA